MTGARMRYDVIDSLWDERRVALIYRMRHQKTALLCDDAGDPVHAALARHAADGALDVASEAEARALFLGMVRA